MDNYECSDSTMDLFEAFVALQEVVSSINYVCGVYIIVLQVALERYQSRLDIKRSPHPFQAQLDYLNRLVKDSDIDCHEQLRVNRHTFMCLCTLVRSVGLSDSKYVLLEEKVAMFLNVIAHDYKNRNIKFNFMRSGQTVSQYFNDVLKAILRLQGVLLKTPEPITANCTDDRWSCFQNCLGALDGTYVRVRVPAIDKPRYRTRKGEIATNVLGVCSQDMQFIYVLPGWEGSASDSRVLRDAVNRPNGLKVPTGFYYLVDAGYTNGEGFLAPYRGQRYHLSTWREGGIPVNPEEFFNMKHSAARNVIERCFGLLKIRWAILRTASYYPIKTQGRIITACCLLHNLIRREMPVDPFEFELNNTPIPQPDLGEEFINTVEPSNQWSDWRDTLANIMFNEWQANRGVGMDSVATSHSRKKSKGKADAGSIGSRRIWTKREELFLISAMRDLCNNPKWKVDNGQFKSGFYGELEKRIIMAFPGSDLRACPHIESKIKIWRKHYGLLYEMTKLSGFRWNDTEKMVLVDSDDVWENFVRRQPSASSMRNKSFPYYEDWLVLFGKDRATGELAEDPADAVEAIAVEEAMGEKGDGSPAKQFNVADFECSMSTNGNASNSSTFSKGGTKRARTTEGIANNIATMTETLGSFLDKTDTRLGEIVKRIGYQHDLSQARRSVNAELLKLPLTSTQRLTAGSLIVKDAQRVDFFFSLSDADKLEWVCLLLGGHV
ncbi:unnamed protein product [Camellia sinensis]